MDYLILYLIAASFVAVFVAAKESRRQFIADLREKLEHLETYGWFHKRCFGWGCLRIEVRWTWWR